MFYSPHRGQKCSKLLYAQRLYVYLYYMMTNTFDNKGFRVEIIKYKTHDEILPGKTQVVLDLEEPRNVFVLLHDCQLRSKSLHNVPGGSSLASWKTFFKKIGRSWTYIRNSVS